MNLACLVYESVEFKINTFLIVYYLLNFSITEIYDLYHYGMRSVFSEEFLRDFSVGRRPCRHSESVADRRERRRQHRQHRVSCGVLGPFGPSLLRQKMGPARAERSAAMEFANKGIRVNTVCPGHIVTDLNRGGPHLQPMIGLTPIRGGGGGGATRPLPGLGCCALCNRRGFHHRRRLHRGRCLSCGSRNLKYGFLRRGFAPLIAGSFLRRAVSTTAPPKSASPAQAAKSE